MLICKVLLYFLDLMMFFNFATINNCLLLKLMELILTISVWLSLFASCSMSCTVTLLPFLLPWWSGLFSCRPHASSYMLDTVDMVGQSHSKHSFSLSVLMFWQMVLLVVPLSLVILHQSPLSLLSCLISWFVFFGLLCHLAHAMTYCLSLHLCLLMVVTSIIISMSMLLSFRPWINCSFNCLSISS